MTKNRMEAFSDGVIAILITIMVLELGVPHGTDLAALGPIAPILLAYVLSFINLAIYWNNHHHLLRATTRINGAAMWSNMLLLFWLSLIPVVTDWIRDDPKAQTPVASLGVIALAAALSYSLLVRSLIRANGKDSLLARAIANDAKGYVSLVLYAGGVAFAAASESTVWVAYVLYVAVAVMWLIPDRRFSRAARED
jgi:uncharacterized membrane protein